MYSHSSVGRRQKGLRAGGVLVVIVLMVVMLAAAEDDDDDDGNDDDDEEEEGEEIGWTSGRLSRSLESRTPTAACGCN